VNSSTVTISQPFYIQEAKVSVGQYQQFDPSYSGSRYVEGVTWYDVGASSSPVIFKGPKIAISRRV
jgi:formylglycine-generating enzyme required for sulfatase activity